jgi:hypothetical protein
MIGSLVFRTNPGAWFTYSSLHLSPSAVKPHLIQTRWGDCLLYIALHVLYNVKRRKGECYDTWKNYELGAGRRIVIYHVLFGK